MPLWVHVAILAYTHVGALTAGLFYNDDCWRTGGPRYERLLASFLIGLFWPMPASYVTWKWLLKS